MTVSLQYLGAKCQLIEVDLGEPGALHELSLVVWRTD